MNKIKSNLKTKEEFRSLIKDLKTKYTHTQLEEMSSEVFSVVELTGFFQDARNVFIYNSLPGEVLTQQFIQKWERKKNLFLPAIVDDDIVFKSYTSLTELKTGALGIKEPVGVEAIPREGDLIIVPGVAFDPKMNRLGRGKGFYDRFLSKTKALKMGVCFDFQLLDSVPVNDLDVKMDVLVSENDLIW